MVPIINSKVNTIATLVENEVFARCGYPRKIFSAYASQIRGKPWYAWCTKRGAESWTTPAYTPRANATKHRDGEIEKGLRLPLGFKIRRRRNATTGLTSSMLLLGDTIARPGGEAHVYVPATREGCNR